MDGITQHFYLLINLLICLFFVMKHLKAMVIFSTTQINITLCAPEFCAAFAVFESAASRCFYGITNWPMIVTIEPLVQRRYGCYLVV